MTKAYCTISVVICTHNRGHLLRENVDSVCAQDFDSYEVIYVDDGSTDNTPQVLAESAAKYPDRLRVISMRNRGAGPARNVGAMEAGGEYLLFADDDIIAPPSWISQMLERREYHGADVLGGGMDPFSMETPAERYMHYRYQIVLGERAREVKALPTANFLVRRDLFLQVGGFSEEDLPFAEDWELCYRLGDVGAKIIYDPAPAVVHHYPKDWEPIERRMKATGAMGVVISDGRYPSLALYVAYSTARFLLSPFWLWRHYPADLWRQAFKMEAVFCRARLHAYWLQRHGKRPENLR